VVKARSGDYVILGLSDGNLNLLRAGKPIMFNLSEVGLGQGKLIIMWGRTELEIVEQLNIKAQVGHGETTDN